MKVKLCGNCPYAVGDIADLYDSLAVKFCCGDCPQQGLMTTDERFPRGKLVQAASMTTEPKRPETDGR